jgi:hypothetical protein
MRRNLPVILVLLLAAACDQAETSASTANPTPVVKSSAPSEARAPTPSSGTTNAVAADSPAGGDRDALATKIAQIQGGKVDYPNRARDIQALNRYISEGKFDMAFFKANKILEQQRNLGKGAPSSV